MRPLSWIVSATAMLLLACSSTTEPPVTNNNNNTTNEASDDFERSQLGPNWTQVQGNGVPGIIGGNLSAMSAGPFSIDWAAAQFPADQFSEIVIAAGKDANLLIQLHVRRQVVSLARYGFHYNPERTPAVWEIKYDGVPTAETRILASAAASGPAAGDVLRIEARGRVINAYRNGQLFLTATDNAPNAVLVAGGTGMTSRIAQGTSTTRYPAPIAASWKGGALR